MDCKVTLTANAGVIVNLDGTSILIDALHNTFAAEFSSLSEERSNQVLTLCDLTPPTAILISHAHPDHYSASLIDEATLRYPDACVIFPERDFSGKTSMWKLGNITVTSVPLLHRRAPEYPPADNFSFIIRHDNKTLFFPGDAEPTSDEMKVLVSTFHPDVAFLPFIWATLPSCRNVLAALNPKNAVLLHLPFPELDTFGYNKATIQARDRFIPDAVILSSFLQSAEFNI